MEGSPDCAGWGRGQARAKVAEVFPILIVYFCEEAKDGISIQLADQERRRSHRVALFRQWR